MLVKISVIFYAHKMNDNLCCGCGTIHADEFERFILQKIKRKLADFKEFEIAGANANHPKIEELKARQIAIENEISETVKKMLQAQAKRLWHISTKVLNGCTVKNTNSGRNSTLK